jgi:enoyl-CoA hydratase
MALIDTHFSHGGRIARIVLNRSEKANALTQAMWADLHAAIEAADADSAVRAIVLKSASPNAFSAGADIAELSEMLRAPERFAANHATVQATQARLYRTRAITVAAIQGACVGGGLGLALACDFRIADASARFALTPARLGLTYSLADSARLYRLVGPAVARRMLLLTETLDADAAVRVGLLTALHASAVFDAALDALLETLAHASAVALEGIKQTLLAIEAGQRDEDEPSRARFAAAFEQPDFAVAAKSFLDKRPVKF